MATLTVEDLRRTFPPDVAALLDASFEVADGHVAALFGPSGCGKTTALRIIAGLERAGGGDVRLDGVSILDRPPHRRGVGLMFQELALFPHLDVRANVAFGLRMARWPRERREARVDELLALMGLTALAGRGVDELSGGERQRVGLARALAPEPEVLLLDEPLGAIDEVRKRALREDLREVLRTLGTTAVVVSHDLRDVFALADDLVVMDAGRVLQRGAVAEVSGRPSNPRVAAMMGYVPLIAGPVQSGHVHEDGVGALDLPADAEGLAGGALAEVFAHPVSLLAVPPDDVRGSGVRATVHAALPEGPLATLEVVLGTGERARRVTVRWAGPGEAPSPGSAVALAVRHPDLRVYPAGGEH